MRTKLRKGVGGLSLSRTKQQPSSVLWTALELQPEVPKRYLAAEVQLARDKARDQPCWKWQTLALGFCDTGMLYDVV